MWQSCGAVHLPEKKIASALESSSLPTLSPPISIPAFLVSLKLWSFPWCEVLTIWTIYNFFLILS